METLSILDIDMATAIDAFRMELKKDYPFYGDLVMNPCKRINDFISRTLKFIRLEEDREIQNRVITSNSFDNPNKKAEP